MPCPPGLAVPLGLAAKGLASWEAVIQLHILQRPGPLGRGAQQLRWLYTCVLELRERPPRRPQETELSHRPLLQARPPAQGSGLRVVPRVLRNPLFSSTPQLRSSREERPSHYGHVCVGMCVHDCVLVRVCMGGEDSGTEDPR